VSGVTTQRNAHNFVAGE